MQRLIERFSVRAVLTAGFAAVIALGAASAGSLGVAWYTVREANEHYAAHEGRIAQLASDARRAMGRVRRLEKDFLLYAGELGFHEARSRYATRLQSGFAEMRELALQIRALGPDPATSAGTTEVEQALALFETGFMQAVEFYGLLEAPRSGLGPRLRALALELEKALERSPAGANSFRVYSEMMRAEQDFRDYPRRRVANDVMTAQRRLLREPAGPRVRELAGRYGALFAQYADVAYATRDARDSYLKAAQRVEPLLDEIYLRQNAAAEAAQRRIEELSHAVAWSAGAVFLAAMTIAALIAWLLSRAIARSTRSLIELTGSVAAGSLEAPAAAGGPAEFRALNESFRTMMRALGEAHDDQRRKTADLEAANRQLGELARRDPLTGLPNRRDFLLRGGDIFALARRYKHELCVLMIDADHFKAINDRHGHAAGDDVLRFLAAVLPLQLRGTDICARIGGEEFAAVLPETGMADALSTAERLRLHIERSGVPTEHAEVPLRVTVSIGVAAFPQGGDSLDALLQEADRQLYEAKRGGRNRVAGAALAPLAA